MTVFFSFLYTNLSDRSLTLYYLLLLSALGKSASLRSIPRFTLQKLYYITTNSGTLFFNAELPVSRVSFYCSLYPPHSACAYVYSLFLFISQAISIMNILIRANMPNMVINPVTPNTISANSIVPVWVICCPISMANVMPRINVKI